MELYQNIIFPGGLVPIMNRDYIYDIIIFLDYI